MSSDSPLFVSDIRTIEKSRFESFVTQLAGPSQGTERYVNIIHMKSSSLHSAAAPVHLEPETIDTVVKDSKKYSVITWKKLDYMIQPGPGAFGRIVTVHFAWVPPGVAKPTKLEEFEALPGYVSRTFGGVADPRFDSSWMAAPFDQTRHAVIHCGTLAIAKPTSFVYFAEEEKAGDIQGAGARVTIHFKGEFERFGSYM